MLLHAILGRQCEKVEVVHPAAVVRPFLRTAADELADAPHWAEASHLDSRGP